MSRVLARCAALWAHLTQWFRTMATRKVTTQMTWAQFKQRVQSAGIKNGDKLWRVRLSYPQTEDNIKIVVTKLGVIIE